MPASHTNNGAIHVVREVAFNNAAGPTTTTLSLGIIPASSGSIPNLAGGPFGSEIISFVVDVEVLFNSATSALISIGKAGALSAFASGIDVKAAAGRIVVAYTGAQLTAIKDLGVNQAVEVLVTLVTVGAGVLGSGNIKMMYAGRS